MNGFLLRKGAWANGRRLGATASPRGVFPLLPLMLLLLGACDSSFQPITREPTDFFAVFGFLDTTADTQFVRIDPLRPTLEPSAERVFVRATTTHLATGAQVRWHDSLVVLDDGRPGRLFYARLPVAPGDAYRLDVQGAGGQMTQAVTQVPPRIRPSPGPLATDFNRRLVQHVTLLDQRRLPRELRMWYEVTPPGAGEPVTLTLPFFGSGQATREGLQITVNLEADREEILSRLRIPLFDSTAVLHRVGLEIEQLSDEWGAPRPVNIDNGFGFFGSIARYTVSWRLEAADLKRLGFAAPG